ncbi:MAG TPA: MFS transporter [Kouleothrix sp.]|jgi:MFS family permease|nr:MFS transporter [Kouleothrix sp.]
MGTTSSASTSGRLSPFAALRYRDFRLLWLGQLVSTAGTQMRIVAVNVQVYELAKRGGAIDPALALGLIGLARAVPLVATALLSGLVADRADRRLLLLLTSIGALISSAVLAAASGLVVTPLWLVYAMVILAAVVGAFEMPARQALVPTLVPPEILPNALSLNIIAWQLATIAGPTLAGLLIAWAGVAPVYWIDAASFLAVVLAVLLMRTHAALRPSQPVTLSAAFDGLRFVRATPLIASTMLLDFFATFFGAAMTLLPLFADKVLHVGPVELGWMYAAPSVGAFVAAAALTSVRIKRQGPVLLWAIAIFGLCTALFGISRSLPLTLLALAGTGASDTVSMVIRQTIRQLLTPDELRGRMTAVNMIFFAGGPQIGELESGIAASLMGGPAAVFLGGALCVAMVGWVAWRYADLRRYHSAV